MDEAYLHNVTRQLKEEVTLLKKEIEDIKEQQNTFKNNIVKIIEHQFSVSREVDTIEIHELFNTAWNNTFKEAAKEQYSNLHFQIQNELKATKEGYKKMIGVLIDELVLTRRDNSLMVSILKEKKILTEGELNFFDKKWSKEVDKLRERLKQQFIPVIIKDTNKPIDYRK